MLLGWENALYAAIMMSKVKGCGRFNALSRGKCDCKCLIYKQNSLIDNVEWMSQDHIDDKSTLVQVMTWCHQAISNHLSQSLQWRHNGLDSVSNHQPHDCFLNRLFRHRSKKTSKLRVTGLCAGNSPEAGEFPAQLASNAENVSIWWRHHVLP